MVATQTAFRGSCRTTIWVACLLQAAVTSASEATPATLRESDRLVELVNAGALTPIARGERFAIYDLGVKAYPRATFLVQSSVTPINLGAEMSSLMDTAGLWAAIRENDIRVLQQSPTEVYLYNWVDGAQGAMVFDVGVVVPSEFDAAPPGLLLRNVGPLKMASLLYVGPFPHDPDTGWQELRWEERARNAGHKYTERLYRELYHHFDYTPSGNRQHVVEVQIEIE